MSNPNTPRLWSDFDGTAVGLVPKWNWKNWSKYPLPGVEGYVDFLQGVQDGGVDIRGIASRRPDIPLRRYVTMRSIAELGLDSYFGHPDQVRLAGHEDEKAKIVAADTSLATVGMIDDKPHKLGVALVKAMRNPELGSIVQPGRRVVLGVVDSPRSEAYMDALKYAVFASHPICNISVIPEGYRMSRLSFDDERPYRRIGTDFSIDVVQLPPYSRSAGADFAQLLHSAAPTTSRQ